MKYAVPILTLFLGVTLGMGFVHLSQATVVGQHSVAIVALEKAQTRADQVYEVRMANVVKLWEEQLKTERELISLVRDRLVRMENHKGDAP